MEETGTATTLDRRALLLGAGAAAIAVTAAACAPAPAPSEETTTTTAPPPPTSLPAASTPGAAAPGGPVTDRDLAVHAARRLTFGQTPATIAAIEAIGFEAWIDQQLHWETIDDSAIEPMLTAYPRAARDAATLSAENDKGRTRNDLASATLVRAIWSSRQLHELLVDFWTNHLNVDMNHDASTFHKPTDDRDVIRRHATGRFADMLTASAKSPAMLLYLDQALSRVDGTRQPIENYARELLELHTVGVDGGYDETDVKEVAWLLSGWTVADRKSGGFRFNPQWHKDGPLATGGDVLGWTMNGLTGQAAGESLLLHLARHPRTARRLAHKLAVRFIGEHIGPDDAVVTRAADAYRAADTAITPMVRALLVSEEFRSAPNRRLRRPIELFAAQLRAIQLQMDPSRASSFTSAASNNLRLLGQVPHSWSTPDGYPDVDAHWASAGAMVARWNMATSISNGLGAPAPTHDLTRVIGTPLPATWGGVLDAAARSILGSSLDDATRDAILSAFGQRPDTPWPATRSARGLVDAVLQSPGAQLR